jgi:hypothetical protein
MFCNFGRFQHYSNSLPMWCFQLMFYLIPQKTNIFLFAFWYVSYVIWLSLLNDEQARKVTIWQEYHFQI